MRALVRDNLHHFLLKLAQRLRVEDERCKIDESVLENSNIKVDPTRTLEEFQEIYGTEHRVKIDPKAPLDDDDDDNDDGYIKDEAERAERWRLLQRAKTLTFAHRVYNKARNECLDQLHMLEFNSLVEPLAPPPPPPLKKA